MSAIGTTLEHSRHRLALIVAVSLLAYLAAVVPLALADTPHVKATVDTASCAACHSTHASTSPVLLRTVAPKPTATDLCLGCHSGGDPDSSNVVTGTVDSFSQPSGHSLAPDDNSATGAKITGCETCHNPHAASSDGRGIPVRTVNGHAVSANSAGRELCEACHDSKDSWYGDGYPSTAKPTHDATGFPVSGTWPGPDTYESASDAHRLIPEATETVGVNDAEKREQGSCLYCHGAHGGKNAYDSLVDTFTVPSDSTLASDQAQGSYAALCFKCHGGSKLDGFENTPSDIKRYVVKGGKTGGHRIVTPGGTLPVGSPLPCFECHNPHGSKRNNTAMLTDQLGGGLGTGNAADVRDYCLTCHTTSDTNAGWDSDSGALSAVSAGDKVVGLPRTGGQLHLSATDGHAAGSTKSCYECHGNDYADAGGHNVHNPNDGTQPAVEATLTLGVVSGGRIATGTPDPPVASGGTTTPSPGPSATLDPLPTVDATSTIAPVDDAAPITISDATSTYTTTATITLSAVDNLGGSGVATTYYALDDAAPVAGTSVTVDVAGPHTLKFWSVDNAGNAETPTSVTFTVEAPPPADTSGTVVSLARIREEWMLGGA